MHHFWGKVIRQIFFLVPHLKYAFVIRTLMAMWVRDAGSNGPSIYAATLLENIAANPSSSLHRYASAAFWPCT